MYKIGLSTCGKSLNEQLFQDYAKNGIDALEISPKWFEYKHINYQSLHDLSKQYGIELWSYHLPFQSTDICSPDIGVRLCSVEYFCELIKQASNIGIHKFVTHAGQEPISLDLSKRAESIKYAQDSLNKLADFAADYDGEICVEDLPRSCLGNSTAEILELISVNDKLRVCLDTNHLLKEDNTSFIRQVGNKIVTLHVSDYDFVDERHWLPGEGCIQWHSVLDALREINYKGVWMYEIGFSTPDSIKRSRDLNCADFVRNAKEIFSGKTISAIE